MKIPQILLAATLLAAPLSLAAQHSHAPGAAPHSHGAATAAPTQKAPGETHAHKSPHGGIVRTAGTYHIELVQQSNEVHVYLLNGEEATAPIKGTTGSVTLLTTANKTSTVALTSAGDHLLAKVPAGATVRTAIVSLKSNGKALSARFEKLDAAKGAKDTTVGYICPMQCEGSASTKPGNCPKCGMALVKKS